MLCSLVMIKRSGAEILGLTSPCKTPSLQYARTVWKTFDRIPFYIMCELAAISLISFVQLVKDKSNPSNLLQRDTSQLYVHLYKHNRL